MLIPDIQQMKKVSYYIELVKPRLTAMALFSGAVGYIAAVPAAQSLGHPRRHHGIDVGVRPPRYALELQILMV